MTDDVDGDEPVELCLPPNALSSILRSEPLADLIDPRIEVPGTGDPVMRFAEFWNVIEIILSLSESSRSFVSREAARAALFNHAPGGGFGIPIFIQDVVLDHLEPVPD